MLLIRLLTLVAVAKAAAAAGEQRSLSKKEMDEIKLAADISRRVYKFTKSDVEKANEVYFESQNKEEAAIVAKFSDKCIVGFRGTKPVESTEITSFTPKILKHNIADILINAKTMEKRDISSRSDHNVKCEIGSGYHDAYTQTKSATSKDHPEDFEDFIEKKCASLPLVFTGHSQGAGLAQIAAVRFENRQPMIINFAPAPTFFGDCDAVPHERIINFINTETDDGILDELTGGLFNDITGGIFNIKEPVQFDVIPFIDKLLSYISPFLDAFVASGLPQKIADDMKDVKCEYDSVACFVGSYKGDFFVLSPNSKGSAAYVGRHEDITEGSFLMLDLFDWSDILHFENWGQVLVSAHDMAAYEKKILKLFDNKKSLSVDGFEPFTWCNPGDDWMCSGSCTGIALCSSGADEDPCYSDKDCRSKLCEWTCSADLCLPSEIKLRCENENGKPNGGRCLSDSECMSGHCAWGGYCEEWKAKPNGASCSFDYECESGHCAWGGSCEEWKPKPNGASCYFDYECESGHCAWGGECKKYTGSWSRW